MGRGRRRVLEFGGPGRSELGPRRDPVEFGLGVWDELGFDDDDPGSGSAGVREPRQPKPFGPMSGAGEKPMPEPMTYLVMSDPRH
ncbi:hypothetical protein [Actinophytocola sp.]|jgi:hypothetical protein|uniref:hypothetical protein n=1 Tax=Actinophytocola sp. TaxID=1872138 RepID=UPI002E175022